MGLRLRLSDRDGQIWCRHSATKFDGWERNRTTICRSAGDTEAEGRTVLAPSANGSTGCAGQPRQAPPTGRGIIDARIGKPLVVSGDESTWGDRSFKLRSYVSVVDFHLGRMMEEAELAAHANVWLPSVAMNQDKDAQFRYLLVMLTSGSALQIIRQQSGGVHAFRDYVRRYNPRSQARSSCISVVGKSQLVSLVDRLCLRDTLESTRP